MKRALLIPSLAIGLFLIGLGALLLVLLKHGNSGEKAALPQTPQARAARITAALLAIKLDHLASEGIYLELQEEGRDLLTALEEKSAK